MMFHIELLFLSGDQEASGGDTTTTQPVWSLPSIQQIKNSMKTNASNSAESEEATYERIRKLQEELIEIQVTILNSAQKAIYIDCKYYADSTSTKRKLNAWRRRTRNCGNHCC